MSKLSLLLQSRLRNAKPKNQFQPWTSEELEEFKPKSEEDQIDSLVLVATLVLLCPGTTSEENYARVRNLSNLLLAISRRLDLYPEVSLLDKYPNVLICTCGNILQSGGENWGLVHHCSKCKIPNYGRRFYLPMFSHGLEQAGLALAIPKVWREWAQVQAALILSERWELAKPIKFERSNHNSVTDLEV